MWPPECQLRTVFWPAPSVYADGVFSAHFTTRSSCVVYDFLFTWKATFKNVIISNVIAARTVQQSSRKILRCKRLAGIAQLYGIFDPSEALHRRASGGFVVLAASTLFAAPVGQGREALNGMKKPPIRRFNQQYGYKKTTAQ